MLLHKYFGQIKSICLVSQVNKDVDNAYIRDKCPPLLTNLPPPPLTNLTPNNPQLTHLSRGVNM